MICHGSFRINMGGDFALQYGITEGYGPLIEKVKSRLKDKFNIGTETDDVIITTGGQQGVELSAKVLLNEYWHAHFNNVLHVIRMELSFICINWK